MNAIGRCELFCSRDRALLVKARQMEKINDMKTLDEPIAKLVENSGKCDTEPLAEKEKSQIADGSLREKLSRLHQDDRSYIMQVLERERLEIHKKQEIADRVAMEYNEQRQPYEHAVAKGIEGVIKTQNGGISFERTNRVYITESGSKCIVCIEATGSRSRDFDAANKAMGLRETPDEYVWHHLDDYDVKKGTITMELVESEAHNASKPHSGGCAQYDAVNGASYNPDRKEEQDV